MAWTARDHGALGLRLLLSGLCLSAAQVSCVRVGVGGVWGGSPLTFFPSFLLQPSQTPDQVSWGREVFPFFKSTQGKVGAQPSCEPRERRGASPAQWGGTLSPAPNNRGKYRGSLEP